MTLPPDLAWMDWGGWRWISVVVAMGSGIYVGWSIRSTNEGTRAFIERRASKYALVEWLASCKDPRECQSIDDEIEAFAHVIKTAKHLCGDLSEESGGHGDE